MPSEIAKCAVCGQPSLGCFKDESGRWKPGCKAHTTNASPSTYYLHVSKQIVAICSDVIGIARRWDSPVNEEASQHQAAQIKKLTEALTAANDAIACLDALDTQEFIRRGGKS